MEALLSVVIPVFLVAGAGYVTVRLKYLGDSVIEGVMIYTQNFAIPCLLFKATMTLDFSAVFDPGLLTSFYLGATTTFLLGTWGARALFNRRPGEAVAIGFGALFSNSVILGLSIVERAYGADALAAAFAIVSIHAPFCYILGTITMEISRADGRGVGQTMAAIGKAMARNALLISIALGFMVNLSGLRLPNEVMDALDMVVRSALPAALFGLGGVLTRYKMRSALGPSLMISFLSLIVHPGIAFLLSRHVFDLPEPMVQAAVITASMAPGVNAYVFARLYNRAEDVAASTVLLATCMSVLSISVWLAIVG